MEFVVTSEFRRRMPRFAVNLQGESAKPCIGDPASVAYGDWQSHYMNAYSVTIGGGTSQIQLNILEYLKTRVQVDRSIQDAAPHRRHLALLLLGRPDLPAT